MNHHDRIVAEVDDERRTKSQKAKPKISADARQNLSSVRVVQKNLVFIVGLPSNLSDESVSFLYSYIHFNLIAVYDMGI